MIAKDGLMVTAARASLWYSGTETGTGTGPTAITFLFVVCFGGCGAPVLMKEIWPCRRSKHGDSGAWTAPCNTLFS